MTPWISLGQFKPSKRRCSIIGKELTALTADLGFKPLKDDDIQRNERAAWSDRSLHAEVRMTAVPGSQGTQWHQDGDTSTSDLDFALVLWANREPTEIKVGDDIYQPKPYEVVVVHNLAGYHRRPPEVSGKRFFFRQRVETPPQLKI